MRRYRARQLLALWLLAIIPGCGDGGPVGTGIAASAITGNVISVESARPASGSGVRLEGPVHVSIDEVAGVQTTTDDNGNFVLSGRFSGLLTVRFRTAQVEASRQFDVPDGSTVVLEDIAIYPQQVVTGAVRQLDFFGGLALVDCTDGTLLVDDLRAQPNQFMVRLVPETVLVSGHGRALQCSDLRYGARLEIQGAVRMQGDRTIEALVVIVAPPSPSPNPPKVRPVRFVGRATLVDCAQGLLLLTSPASGRSRLHLQPDTRYFEESGTGSQVRTRCTAIAIGDRVYGNGRINVTQPGAIDAEVVVFAAPARASGAR